MSTVLVIPAAGSGTRLGEPVPKAFVALAGQPLLWHAIRGAVRSEVVDHVVVAAPSGWEDRARTIAEAATSAAASAAAAGAAAATSAAAVTVVTGGVDRVASVAAALRAVPAEMRSAGKTSHASADLVLVHDAARCLTPAAVFARVVEVLSSGAEAVVPVLPVTDTVRTAAPDDAGAREVLRGGLDRSVLRRVQTPQGFRREVLERAHELQRSDPELAATDDSGLVERLGSDVYAVAGDEAALKITHPIDLRLALLHLEEISHD